ncbi:MAG: transferrin-binding protein-like solute binding protein [Deltaproteobacteria bacterium]|nr:transferrin-binding protein-like solute binding protein [Deltaproteobacteria bacterium]
MITSTKRMSLAAVSALAITAAMPVVDALAEDELPEYGHGLQASTQDSPASSRPSDSLENLAGTAFAPLSAAVRFERKDEGQLGVVMLEEDEAAHVESITSDGQGGFSVVYIVDGEETEVQFGAEDYTSGGHYHKQIDDESYFLWHAPTYAGEFPKPVARRYFSLFGWQLGLSEAGSTRGHSAYGVLTPSGRLVNLGSATYEGHINADVWKNFTGTVQAEIQGQLYGELTLEAEFSEGTISGDVDTLWYRPPEGEWLQISDTNSIVISDGEIDGSRFHAGWQGEDTDADSSLDGSVRGLEGSMLGAFYGPNGEEVGGVLTGQRAETDEVINGRFGGESHRATITRELWGKFMPGRDDGIAVSPGAAVYADSSDDTLANLLPDGDVAFAPLSAALVFDWARNQVRTTETGGAYLKSISSDGANGFQMTYVIDGRESSVHFGADDRGDEYSYNVNRGPGGSEHYLWSWTDSMIVNPDDRTTADRTSGSSEFDYLDINGWAVYPPGDGFRIISTYGPRTRAADMPAGSATYEGRLAANIWDGDDPNWPSGVTDVGGDLTLEADFDQSTISGRVDGIYVRPENSGDRLSLSGSNSLAISNGRIVGSWFDADWSGVDTNPGSAPEVSMRDFEGTMEGEFFGPAAEEVGGVIGGHRPATDTTPEQFIHGGFGARQQD